MEKVKIKFDIKHCFIYLLFNQLKSHNINEPEKIHSF
jgi:hypothetical protein